MAKSDVVVRFLGDTASLDRALNKTEKSTSKWAGKMGKAAAVAGGVAVAAGVVGKVLWDVTEAAMADEKAQAALAQTMVKTQKATSGQVDAMEDFVTKTSIASGIVDDDLRPALSRLMIAGRTAQQSQADLGVAMDIAAAKGISLETVTNAMSKAALGQTTSMQRLGIQTKDAAGKTLSYDQILKNASATMGGAAATAANTTAGKMQRLSIAFQETKEAIGAKLLPVVNKLAEWFLNKGIPAMQRMGEQIMPHLRKAFDSIRKAIQDNRPQLEQLGQAFMKIAGFVMKYVVPALIKFQAFQWGAIISAIGAVVRVVQTLTRWFSRAYDAAERFINKAKEIGSGLWSNTLGRLPGLAGGGTVTRGGLTLVGEQGPEVLALPTGAQVVPLTSVRRPAANAAGGIVININGPVTDPVAAARWMRDAVIAGRRAGVTF